MTIKKLSRHVMATTLLSFGFSSATWAASDDALGQFLEQNFSAQASPSATESDDPIRAIAHQVNPSNTVGNLMPLSPTNSFQTTSFQPSNTQNFQAQPIKYDFIQPNPSAAQHISNVNFDSGSFAADSFDSYNYAPLLNARSALVMNANTGKILYQKNMDSVRSIASISKLMSAMVLLDAKLNMYEDIEITADEIDRLKGTGSRLSIGTVLTRGELLHLGLMSSENRAIHALARTYPGGMDAFVAAMNAKARSLGMNNSRFYEPTGLDPRNVSTARDLSVMVRAANKYPQIRTLSTSNYGQVYTSAGRTQTFKNTNALVREGSWDISLQKTGYIKEAGRSMVLQAKMGNEPVVIVVLGASSSSGRVNDARKLSSMVFQDTF